MRQCQVLTLAQGLVHGKHPDHIALILFVVL